MKFRTHNDQSINTHGTYRIGSLNAAYADMVAAFGQPMSSGSATKQAQWNIRFEDGSVATIYDWKSPVPLQHNMIWAIGGHGSMAEILVHNALYAAQRRAA